MTNQGVFSLSEKIARPLRSLHSQYQAVSSRLETAHRLGARNILNVLVYRGQSRFGWMERILPIGTPYSGIFFSGNGRTEISQELKKEISWVTQADDLLEGKFHYYERELNSIGNPPQWFYQPSQQKALSLPTKHWSRIGFFSDDIGDIKNIWEISRMSWVLLLARAYLVTQDEKYKNTLNQWLSDWIEHNPWNQGINWSCGQETSIRLFHVLLAARLLGEEKQPTTMLLRFVQEHLRRILPSLSYAIAQDNNHGTSEASALFLGGSWLLSLPSLSQLEKKEAQTWSSKGREVLEERVQFLIEEDGSFSQYSINYHRVMLDTLVFSEFWRELLGQERFSSLFYQRAKAATHWLQSMTDPTTGEVPNLGTNDGARLYLLSQTNYRDFRQSVQLASVLFRHKRAYSTGNWDQVLDWLQLQEKAPLLEKEELRCRTHLFSEGGYAVLDAGKSCAMVRFPPLYRFRPSHADALHLDLWIEGKNVLRDGGTFSYNTDMQWVNYFRGIRSHNTVELDDQEPMPFLGRFLFGDWLKPAQYSSIQQNEEEIAFVCSYETSQGCFHERSVQYKAGEWIIKDKLRSFREKAVLRWRLLPSDWILEGNTCFNSQITLKIESDSSLDTLELTEGWESLFYGEKQSIPVLEVTARQCPILLITRIFQN